MTILVARCRIRMLFARVCGPEELRTLIFIEWDTSRLQLVHPPLKIVDVGQQRRGLLGGGIISHAW